MTTLLLDGDHLLYTACAAVEREVQWDDQNHVLFSNAGEALDVIHRLIAGKLEALGADNEWIVFSGPDNFRKKLCPTYKASRGRKPLCYARLLDELDKHYWLLAEPTLEGDDLMGIKATHWAKEGVDIIIVADDKDMKTIPGQLYAHGELLTITEEQADYWFMFQTLTGDSTDGYSGCPGIGPKKAEAILHDALDGLGSMQIGPTLAYMWPAVVAAYKKAGLTEEDTLLQARLARILRAGDWDDEKQEVKLWTP